jgi:fructan beta-fructosidase
MKKIILVLLVLLLIASCKIKGKDSINDSSPGYSKIHYSSTEHNVGAPVALIFKNGTYSLFYNEFKLDKKAFCPTYLTISKDMIHWQPAQEVAFTGTKLNILNRTIVLDTKTSNLFALMLVDPDKNEENNNSYFKLSFSNNQGKTWTDNATKVDFPSQLKNDFNPTVYWDEIHGKWILTVIDNQTVKFYSSLDLKKWKFESLLEKELQYTANIWLKATIFPVNNGTNWVLLIDQEFVNPRDGSSVQYFIGTFDGQNFKSPISTKSHWLDYGKDNVYNVVCQGLSPTADPLVIGWKNNIDYTMIGSMKPFWGSFTVPRTLMLDEYSGEKILASQPIKSLSKIESKNIKLNNLDVTENLDISKRITIPLTPSEITIKFKTSEKTSMTFPARYGVQFENDKAEKLIIGYDAFKEWFFIDRTIFSNVKDNSQFKGMDVMPSYNSDSVMVITLIMDDSSIEMFVQNGKQVMTENFLLQSKFNKVSLFAENGIIKIKELTIRDLKNIWKQSE